MELVHEVLPLTLEEALGPLLAAEGGSHEVCDGRQEVAGQGCGSQQCLD